MGWGRAGSGTREVLESGGTFFTLPSGCEDVQQKFVRVADPHCRVAMVAQRIASVGMEEDVQHTVVKRQPFDDIGKLRTLESELVRPFWMRANGLLVEPAELQGIAEMRRDFIAELPGGVAGGGVEVDVGVPGLNGRGGEEGHGGVDVLAPVEGERNLRPGAVVGLVCVFYYLDVHPARASFNPILGTSLLLRDPQETYYRSTSSRVVSRACPSGVKYVP